MSEQKTLVAKYKCRNCEMVYLAHVLDQVTATSSYHWIQWNNKVHYAPKNPIHDCVDKEMGIADLIAFTQI